MSEIQYDQHLSSISIIGAAGKMGRGIVLSVLQYFADRMLSGMPIPGKPAVIAMDTSELGLEDLQPYLQSQMLKYAERNIIAIRNHYKDNEKLVENSDHIDYFRQRMMARVVTTTSLSTAAQTNLIFEAIPEIFDLKSKVLTSIRALTTKNTWILSNTSSIPIEELERISGWEGKIIGFHFYNPASVQKLLEIIVAKNTEEDLVKFATWMAGQMRKKVVYSNDLAGFIGNGMFIREINFALNMVRELEKDMPTEQAIFLVDKITRDYLVRPMGIFQLMDYVGLDIVLSISGIMQDHLQEKFDFRLLEGLQRLQMVGGQNPDGSQKDGIFQYDSHQPAEVFSPRRGIYTPIIEIESKTATFVGEYMQHPEWKKLRRSRNIEAKLHAHFKSIFSEDYLVGTIAKSYLEFYRDIGNKLLELKVTNDKESINEVMKLGFHQLYGPFNPFLD